MAKDGFLYGDENTLKQSLLSIRRFLSIVESRGGALIDLPSIIYAEVTDVVSDTEVKGLQKVWDTEKSPSAGYDAPLGTPIEWDTDKYNSEEDKTFLQKNIIVDQSVSEGDFIEVIYYSDKSQNLAYKARISGGGAERPYIEITGGSGPEDYTGSVLTSPTDSTPTETGVSIKARNGSTVTGGTIPIGKRYFADLVGDVYYIQPSVFLGT